MKVRNPRRARGFTLIELLVVIGVILILVGIAVYAFNRLDPSERATRVTLLNARGMLAELEMSAPGEIARINALGDVAAQAEIYRAMYRIPANQTALNKMSSKQVRAPSGTGDVPRLIDAWGNDLVYVPSKITGVGLGLRAAGGTDFVSTNQTIRGADGRPFFASPGPDGKIQNGDDNVYSFEN